MDGFYELICFTFYPSFEQGFYLQMKIQCNRTIVLIISNIKSTSNGIEQKNDVELLTNIRQTGQYIKIEYIVLSMRKRIVNKCNDLVLE